MRIDRLEISNFKKFATQTFDLHPRFTLLVGDNGSGKTSVLDALAVALGVWFVDYPDTTLANSARSILPAEIRLDPQLEGDRIQFAERRPVAVGATGRIGDKEGITWTRQIREDGKRTSNKDAQAALAVIKDIYQRDAAGEQVLCPVIAYYGAGRAWHASNKREPKSASNGPARRWAAFYDCFGERIRTGDLQEWFKREAIASVRRKGQMRPGFEVVKQVVLGCIPGADDVWFEPDRGESGAIVLSIEGHAQPFTNLSAGQRMMLSLVADIAIKAVTQNAYLLPPDELGPEDKPLPRLLQQTPGVVLIDELDVHLHPKWQRRVASDLKRFFPSIQFVCTSHSPQVIGEVSKDEVRLLRPTGSEPPSVAYGADSNWILDHVMEGATSENPEVRQIKEHAEEALADGDLPAARKGVEKLRDTLDGNTGELVRLESSLETLESLTREEKMEAPDNAAH